MYILKMLACFCLESLVLYAYIQLYFHTLIFQALCYNSNYAEWLMLGVRGQKEENGFIVLRM